MLDPRDDLNLPPSDLDEDRERPIRRPVPEWSVPRGRGDGVIRETDAPGMKNIADAINRLRGEDESYVCVARISPDRYGDGTPARGHTTRWPVSDLRGPEDLIERIRSEYGGFEWDLRFTTARPNGRQGYFKNCRIQINAKPKKPREEDEAKVAGGDGHVISPDNHLVQQTFNLLKEQIGRPDGEDKALKMVREIMQITQGSGQNPLADLLKEQTKLQQLQLDRAHETTEKLRSDMMASNPGAEVLKLAMESSTNKVGDFHKDMKAEREHLLAQAERDRERAEQRVQDAQKRLDDQRRDEEADRKRLLDDHRREMENLRERYERQLSEARGDHKAEIRRLEGLVDAERTTARHQREEMEANKRTELAAQKGVYDAQIASLNARIESQDRRIIDLESTRDRLQEKLLDEKSERKDSLSNLRETVETVKALGGSFLGDREGPKSELAETLTALKESGIIDSAKGIVTNLGEALKRPAAPPVVAVAIDPRTGQPVPGGIVQQSAPPAVHASPPARAAAEPRPAAAAEAPEASQQEAAPEPPQLSDQEKTVYQGIAPHLEEAMDSGRPIEEIAATIKESVPLALLRQILKEGATMFLTKVESVAPDSGLLSTRGETWIQSLFMALEKIVPGE